MKLAYSKYILKFREPARTSRGEMTEKTTYFLKIWDEANPAVCGYGETSILPGLSPESEETIELKLDELKKNLENNLPTGLGGFPALKFGLEQAILDFSNEGKGIYFASDFTRGEGSLEINGLIWMGTKEQMQDRLLAKIREGYKCIKIKIGAISWNDELELIRLVRKTCGEDIEIRVDANGGLHPDNLMYQLDELAKLNVHSIEQPIPPRNFEFMRFLCEVSPVAIALDEELIGIYRSDVKRDLLDFIKPRYIILKPSLCGGFSGAEEWIELAKEREIGWWITSALESSIGLDALSQFAAKLKVEIPQGLGTGNLYTNNFKSPLNLSANKLTFSGPSDIFKQQLEKLQWI